MGEVKVFTPEVQGQLPELGLSSAFQVWAALGPPKFPPKALSSF